MPKKVTLPSRDSLTKMSNEDLVRLVQSFGKQANQRLRQIEKSGFAESSYAYGVIESDAYSKKRYLTTTKDGQIKFNVNTRNIAGANKHNQLVGRASAIIRFLESKTSTVSGTKAVFEHSYEEYVKKYGTTLSREDYGPFWKSGVIQKYSDIFGSKNAVKLSEKLEGLSIETIEGILRAGGFNENATAGQIEYEELEQHIDNWVALGVTSPFDDDSEDDYFL